MLGLANYYFADSNGAGLANRFAEKCVRLLTTLRGNEVVRGLEVAGIDLFFLYKVENIDRLRLLDRGRLEIFISDDDEFPLSYS